MGKISTHFWVKVTQNWVEFYPFDHYFPNAVLTQHLKWVKFYPFWVTFYPKMGNFYPIQSTLKWNNNVRVDFTFFGVDFTQKWVESTQIG
jgi:hypothetical protein